MLRWSPPRPSVSDARCGNWVAVLMVVLCCSVFGCKERPLVVDLPKGGAQAELTEKKQMVDNLIQSEDLLLDLTPRLIRLAKWFQENSAGRQTELADDLKQCESLIGIADRNPAELFQADSSEPGFLEVIRWPMGVETSQPGNPWEAANGLHVGWETLKFGVVAGDFTNDRHDEIALHTKVEGRGRTESGSALGMKAHQIIVFKKSGTAWNLIRWVQEDFFVERTQQLLFREVLGEVLPDEKALSNAQRSFKDEIILKSSRTGGFILPIPEYVPWTNLTSDNILPSVSVVDFNNDGLEDLFLTARWGPTQMLKNMGDGTYTDVAEEIGLHEEFLVNCVLFVDLDNDGDKDAIMGRPMEPAKYFENLDGIFKDVTKVKSDIGRQFFTSGISAADVNRDGLVDIYLSNYPPLNKESASFEQTFLNEEERARFLEKRADSNRWLNLAGSANVLLMNRGGGRLERVPYDEELAQWHRSFQAVWADIDDDGDDDLYVCNDFAPDSMLRNDTPQGAAQPVFVDVTSEVLTYKGFGFGMGASYGDFDRDGDLDLYVSNMFSKAGRRIIQKMKSVDQRIEVAAAGCFLFVNDGGKFTQSAGAEDDQYHVNQVGWSYGGQWGDFDNNSQLDLYVPTGFYTAPEEIDTQVDT